MTTQDKRPNNVVVDSFPLWIEIIVFIAMFVIVLVFAGICWVYETTTGKRI